MPSITLQILSPCLVESWSSPTITLSISLPPYKPNQPITLSSNLLSTFFSQTTNSGSFTFPVKRTMLPTPSHAKSSTARSCYVKNSDPLFSTPSTTAWENEKMILSESTLSCQATRSSRIRNVLLLWDKPLTIAHGVIILEKPQFPLTRCLSMSSTCHTTSNLTLISQGSVSNSNLLFPGPDVDLKGCKRLRAVPTQRKRALTHDDLLRVISRYRDSSWYISRRFSFCRTTPCRILCAHALRRTNYQTTQLCTSHLKSPNGLQSASTTLSNPSCPVTEPTDFLNIIYHLPQFSTCRY